MRWNTITEYIDRETGELLKKKHLENGEYIKIKLNTKYKINEKNGTRINRWECEKNNQQQIKFTTN